MRDRGNEIKSKQTHLTTVFEKSKLLRLKSVQLVCIRILFIEFCTLYNPLVKMENLKLPTVALSYSKKFIRGTFLFFLNVYIFLILFYFWLCCVFVAALGLSLVAGSGGYSSLWCAGFSLRWLLLLRSTGSRRTGFSSCGTWAQQLWLVGSRAQAQQLWCTGLAAPRHVGSSWTRDQTRVPCVSRRILNHCTTREVPGHIYF